MDEMPHPFRPTGALPADPLGTFAGHWDARRAAHLLRRAGFGGSPADVAALARGTMHEAVSTLVSFPSRTSLPSAPVDALVEPDVMAPVMRPAAEGAVAPDSSIVEMRKARRLQERKAILALQLWWINRMIATPAPLQEKMTLFWHGHFTTAAIQKGVTPAEIVAQNGLFRSYALGNARELTGKVAMDPAMLRYLDNIHNEAAHPNENFARELMELYTLGIGNYSEADVREAARAWTGLRVRRATGEVFLNPRLHDDGPKTFLGRTGNFAGPDIIAAIFAQPAAARFFATKLLTFFVYADPEPELVDAVARELRAHDFDLAPVMTALLSSNVFYSERTYRALVKSPVEYVVGSYRLFGVAAAPPAALAALRRMTQVLFYPPNVKGWPGGSAWLSSSTVLARENFANGLMTANVVDGAPWLLAAGGGDARTATTALVDAIVQGDASPAARAKIEAYLSASDEAMMDAAPAPRDTPAVADRSTMTLAARENIDGRMRGGAYLTMATPAYQLA